MHIRNAVERHVGAERLKDNPLGLESPNRPATPDLARNDQCVSAYIGSGFDDGPAGLNRLPKQIRLVAGELAVLIDRAADVAIQTVVEHQPAATASQAIESAGRQVVVGR